MKTIKKSLSLMLALMMLLSTFACVNWQAFANSGNYYTYEKDGYTYYYSIKSKKAMVEWVEVSYDSEESPSKALIIPNKIKSFPVVSVKSIYAYDAVSLVIPDSVILLGSDEGGYADIYNVKAISIGKGVKSISNGFFECADSVAAINVNKDNQFYSSESGVLYNKDKTVLIKYPMGKSSDSFTVPYGVKTIGTGAFYHGYFDKEGKYPLKTVILTDSVETLEPNAFRNTGIVWIQIGKGLQYYKGDAISCNSLLKYITVNADNPYFAAWKNVLYSKDLTKLYKYPAKKSGKAYKMFKTVTEIGEGAFSLAGLQQVIFSDSVKIIGNSAFYGCEKLSKAAIPASVIAIGDWSFRETGLTVVALPKNVTKLGYGAYEYCSSLSVVNLSKTKIKSIGRETFFYDGITALKLPETLQKIGVDAFSGNKMKGVVIPASVVKIGDYAFAYNNKLKTVMIKGKTVKIAASALPYRETYNEKKDRWIKTYKVTIKAPKGSTAEKFAKKYGIKFVALK